MGFTVNLAGGHKLITVDSARGASEAIGPKTASPASGPSASAIAAAYPTRMPSVGDIRIGCLYSPVNPRRMASGASGRTSTAPIDAPGHRAAQSSAASMEGSSRTMNPASCSFVSA